MIDGMKQTLSKLEENEEVKISPSAPTVLFITRATRHEAGALLTCGNDI
jgi:hypothetical protein